MLKQSIKLSGPWQTIEGIMVKVESYTQIMLRTCQIKDGPHANNPFDLEIEKPSFEKTIFSC